MINQSSNQTPDIRPKVLSVSKTVIPSSYDTSTEGYNSWALHIKSQVHVEFVPTNKMVQYKKLFLNVRIINAEDVTSNIKYAELEGKRIEKTGENISELKTNKDKVKLSDDNMSEENRQKLANLDISDNLKYSTVDIFIKEPQLRVAEIAVTNTTNIDNKYKFAFFYSAKNAFVEGYYLIQRIIVGLIMIWPILIIAGLGFYFYRKNQSKKKVNQTFKEQNTAS